MMEFDRFVHLTARGLHLVHSPSNDFKRNLTLPRPIFNYYKLLNRSNRDYNLTTSHSSKLF